MTYGNAWIYTCGILCLYPLAMFAAGYWLAKNGHRINIKLPWRRDQ